MVMPPAPPPATGSSTRPYLIRALHDWCTDNGFTPYIAVFVDASVQVPTEYVKNNEIVLNIGFEATTALKGPKKLSLADSPPATSGASAQQRADDTPPEPPSGGRPALKRIK